MIKPEQAADIEPVRNVILSAFPDSSESDLVDSLRENGNLSISLVAQSDSLTVGHIGFSPVSIKGRDSSRKVVGLGLAPVSVRPSHQHQGIGSQLIRAGIDACQTASVDFVVVLGDPEFYQRFGFTTASSIGLLNEYGVDAEFMVRVLNPSCVGEIRGTLQYSPEFQALSD